VKTVDAFEREPALVERSRETLRSIGADNIRVFQAGDVLGSNEREAYDAVLVSAGAPHVPRTLLDQLRQGGRLVIPIGSMRSQDLVRATKTSHGTELSRLGPCAFVPLIGGEAWPEQTGDDDVSRRPILR
jgi:protein-L-isoaspartate(D-aspartate) O-methyltransferase